MWHSCSFVTNKPMNIYLSIFTFISLQNLTHHSLYRTNRLQWKTRASTPTLSWRRRDGQRLASQPSRSRSLRKGRWTFPEIERGRSPHHPRERVTTRATIDYRPSLWTTSQSPDDPTCITDEYTTHYTIHITYSKLNTWLHFASTHIWTIEGPACLVFVILWWVTTTRDWRHSSIISCTNRSCDQVWVVSSVCVATSWFNANADGCSSVCPGKFSVLTHAPMCSNIHIIYSTIYIHIIHCMTIVGNHTVTSTTSTPVQLLCSLKWLFPTCLYHS